MIAEIGHFALAIAFVIALLQSVLPLWGAARDSAPLMSAARSMAAGQFIFVLVAFLALTTAYVTSDFSVFNVAQNSHSRCSIKSLACGAITKAPCCSGS